MGNGISEFNDGGCCFAQHEIGATSKKASLNQAATNTLVKNSRMKVPPTFGMSAAKKRQEIPANKNSDMAMVRTPTGLQLGNDGTMECWRGPYSSSRFSFSSMSSQSLEEEENAFVEHRNTTNSDRGTEAEITEQKSSERFPAEDQSVATDVMSTVNALLYRGAPKGETRGDDGGRQ